MENEMPSLDVTLGILEISMALSMFLSGVITLQTWNYFRSYARDPMAVRVMVVVIHILDVLQSVMLLHSLYSYTVVYFGQYDKLQSLLWSFKVCNMLLGANIIIVQAFFILRVYQLTQRVLLAASVSVLCLARIILQLYNFVTLIRADSLAVVFSREFRWQVTALLSVGATSDVVIAVATCWALMRLRSGFSASDKLVDKLIVFSIGSGLLTSIMAVLELITYLAMKNFVFMLFFAALGKTFSTALLASLNERNQNRQLATFPPKQHPSHVETQIAYHVETHVAFDSNNDSVELGAVSADGRTPTSRDRATKVYEIGFGRTISHAEQ